MVHRPAPRAAPSGRLSSTPSTRYKIPHQYFFDMIDGVSSDLEPRRIQTFDELYDYCYHVASVVGLTIIHIFEFSDRRRRCSWPKNAA